MDGERMPLARKLLASGEVKPGTTLFDIQVASDVVEAAEKKGAIVGDLLDDGGHRSG